MGSAKASKSSVAMSTHADRNKASSEETNVRQIQGPMPRTDLQVPDAALLAAIQTRCAWFEQSQVPGTTDLKITPTFLIMYYFQINQARNGAEKEACNVEFITTGALTTTTWGKTTQRPS